MPERDETLVTVHLDQARQYRDLETYIVKTVGPGRAEVPAYMAKKWGIKSTSEAKAESKTAAPADEAKAG